MDPARKRRIRLVVALTTALVLAGGLVYTSFSAGSPAKTPTELLATKVQTGQTYKLTGKVADGSVKHDGDTLLFRVRDRDGTTSVPVAYTGSVPDPFREGREVIVTVSKDSADSATYTGEKDSLITKCPSKFIDENGNKPAGTY
jgi:cytochrome c-type biogenesis protein CcmE